MAFDLYSNAQGAIDAANLTTLAAFGTLEQNALGAARQAEAAIASTMSVFVTTARTAADAGQAAVTRVVETLQGLIVGIRERIVQVVTYVVSGFIQVRSEIIKGLVGAASSFATSLSGLPAAVSSYIASALPSLLAGVASFTSSISSVVSTVSSALSTVFAPLRAITGLGVPALLGLAGLIGAITTITRTTGLAVISASGSVIAAGVRNLTAGITFIFNGIQSGLTAVAGIAKSAWSALATGAKAVWSFAVDIGQFVVNNVQAAIGAFTSLVGTALRLGIAFGQVVAAGSALAAFAGAVWAATSAALTFANAASDLNSRTGFGLGRSAGILDRFGIQGVSAGGVQSVFANQTPFVANLKAQAFGLPSIDSASFGESLARRFGQNAGSVIGQFMNRSMMKVIGIDNPEFQRLASTSPTTQRQNTAFQRQVDSSLGLSPQALDSLTEQIPAALSRLGYLVTKVGQTLVTVALPLIEDALSTITNTLGAQAGGIRGAIESAVRFVFVKVGPMFVEGFSTIVSMTATGVQNLVAWGQWLTQVFPQVLANGMQTVATVLRNFSNNFGQWASAQVQSFTTWLSSLGGGINGIVQAVTSFFADQLEGFASYLVSVASSPGGIKLLAHTVAAGLDAISNVAVKWASGFGTLMANVENFIVDHLGPLATKLGLSHQNPQANAAAASGGLSPTSFTSQVDDFFNNTLLHTGSGLLDQAGLLRQSGVARGNAAQKQLDDFAKGLGESAQSAIDGIVNTGNNAAGFFASPDGSRYLGQGIAEGISGFLSPAVSALESIEPGIRDFASAAQAYKQSLGSESQRNAKFDQMIEATRTVKDAIDRNTAVTRDGLIQVAQGGSLDVTAGVVLSSYSAARAAAIKRLP